MKQYRILLVEDEHDIADLVKLNLENEGYKVSHARDGVDALNALRKRIST